MFHVAVLDKKRTTNTALIEQLHSLHHLPQRVIPHSFCHEEDLLDSYYYGNRYHALIVQETQTVLEDLRLEENIRRYDQDVPIVLINPSDELSVEGYRIPLFRYYRETPDSQELYDLLVDLINEEENHVPNTFIFNNGQGYHRLDICEIRYFHAEENRVLIYTSKTVYKFRESIRRLEEALERCDFCRIHRGYLVNVDYIRTITGSTVILKDGDELPLSKKHGTQIREKLKSMMGLQRSR
jgi:DNA-binding LytR/AlgR family response regulator